MTNARTSATTVKIIMITITTGTTTATIAIKLNCNHILRKQLIFT